jgi:SAM-dependent methyltransferase
LYSYSPQKRENLDKKLTELYHKIRSRFKVFGTFQDVLTKSSGYSSADLKDEQEPEEFAKRWLIEPLIEILGYETVSETVLPSPVGRKKPDYTIRPKNQERPIFYVEAEPFNTDLYMEGKGVSQVKGWLLSRASKTSYGIATDGFQWIILKFDDASAQSKPFFKVDLKPVFLKILNPGSFITQEEVEKIERDFLALEREYVSLFLENYLEKIEEEKEEITKRFYNDYVRYVFGYDKKGNTVQGAYLLNKVMTPSNATSNGANLFSVIFMNRLIFIRFLEDRGIVPKDLLKKLLERYKSSPTPGTFYETYLKLLFYEVFNKSNINRISNVRTNALYSQIPYLNGGLFREVIKQERNYNIDNEGVELVLENLLDKYRFGLESGINPDILGYIFERTINFISGTGTNQQKMQGAYYTPDDVVEFIIESTLTPIIFRKMVEGLRESGWSDTDLKGYNSIEDILNPENVPKNPRHIRKMIDLIDTVRVLDPACGSGHFLTAMLSLILRVKGSLLSAIGESVDRYRLKRDIISHNLFGVDIDPNAVEIARLRLWLSLIEEVTDPEHIETLPNIDFNIIAGNTVVGWLHESLQTHPLTNLLEDLYIKETLDSLRISYQKSIDSVTNLLEKMRIEDTIKAYEILAEVYSSESGEQAVRLKETLENIRKKLYEVINNSYIDFLHENSNLAKNELNELAKSLANRIPFHWKMDFGNVFLDGGFDVVVGNPPYIEDRNYSTFDLGIIRSSKKANKGKRKKIEEPLFYDSRNCGNTHAYFIERSIKLLRQKGRFGFIVPIALVSTDRMSWIREFIHNNSSKVEYFNFDDRPGKIFGGIEHCRETIVVTEKGAGVSNVTTSKYHRWHSRDRSKLLKTLKTHEWKIPHTGEIIPKIGTKTEEDILAKLRQKSSGKFMEDFLKDSGPTVWYHNAPQYWTHAHTRDYLPKVEYYSKCKEIGKIGEKIPYDLKETKISSHYKPLTLDAKDAFVANGLLNSSLFYWWFVVWSDGRDLLAQHIKTFPINVETIAKNLKDRLRKLVDELMRSYDQNSNTKINERAGGYTIKIKEIIPSKSKDIIDQIDDIFAECFDFTEHEKEFIKKFDIGFRIESMDSQE